MNPDPRGAAQDLFLSWESSGATLDQSLEKHLPAIGALSKKDRNLFNTIVFGVFRNRIYLDALIDLFSHIPRKKINIQWLYLLRSGLFQLYFLNRIPDFAAIDTCVTLAGKKGGKKTAGFINAVLRAAAQNKEAFTIPALTAKPAEHIRLTYSLPLWIAKRWIKAFGLKKTEQLCRQINAIPPISLRTNRLKTDRGTLFKLLENSCRSIEKTAYSPCGLRIAGPAEPLHNIHAFREGLFQVQDEAAQLATCLLAPRPGERILDACAGLGGKTCHIAQVMQNNGTITAMDIGAKKLDMLASEADRLGIRIINTQRQNLLKTGIKDVNGFFDRVLLDAPCSGLGVLRRNPDTRYRRSLQDIRRMAAQQKKLINAASNLVRFGGILVYVVCSCEREENEDVVTRFLKKRKDFSIDRDFKSDTVNELTDKNGFFKTYPGIHNMDGFFAVRLRRKQKTP